MMHLLFRGPWTVGRGLLLALLLTACLSNGHAYAQSASNRGWFTFDHTQKLSSRWNLTFDGQLRSGPEFRILETLILRPGLTYAFSKSAGVGAGYAYIANWGEGGDGRSFAPEHRAWEQLTLKYNVARTPVDHRLRLEQRFIEQREAFRFAQRLRYRIRTRIPLTQRTDPQRGSYLLAQNELFLNVQHQGVTNGQTFDQNRAHIGLGYQWKPNLAVEGGYMHRYVEGPAARQNHIVQVSVFTVL